MVHADTILESIVTACRQHDDLPSDLTYATIILDEEGEHSDVSPPLVEFRVENIERDMSRNSEKWGVETDANGTEIGYIYTQWWDLYVTANVFTVTGTRHTHRELEQQLRRTLYRYDKCGLNNQLPYPDDPTTGLKDVNWLRIDETAPDHNFGMSPTVRTRDLGLDIGFTHEVRTTDLGIEFDTVEEIHVPTEAVIDPDNADKIELTHSHPT